MNRFIFITGLLILIGFPLRGISDNKGYLEKKIDKMIIVSKNALYFENDSGYVTALKARDLALKIGYYKGAADAWEAISLYYNTKRMYPQAIEAIQEYLKIHEQLKDDSVLVNGWGRIGGYCIITRNMDIAMKFLNRARLLAISTKKEILVGLIDHGYALYYYANHDYNKTIQYCLNGLSRSRHFGNDDLNGRFYRKLGDAYIGLKNYQRALTYYDSSTALFKKVKLDAEVGMNFTRIGHVYQLMGDHKTSLKYNFKSLEIREKIGNKSFIGSSFSNIANNYLSLKNPDSALFYLKKAETELTFSTNYAIKEKVFYRAYYIYKERKDLANASKYIELYIITHDKAKSEENQVKIGAIAVKTFMEDQEIENKLQKQQIKTKNVQLLLFTVTLLLLLVILLFTMLLLRRIRKQKKIQEELNSSLEKEISIRKMVESDLQLSEQRYRFLTENSPDLIIREDMDFRKSFVSPSSNQILGYTPNEILNIPGFLDFIHPDSLHDWIAGIMELKRTKKPTRIVFRAKRKNSSMLWAECMINPVMRNNELVEMVTVLRDITQRVEYEEEIEEHSKNKELLMREVHHRVKNNLGILQSVVRMHRNKFVDQNVQNLLDDLQFRVQTMAMVHNQLHISKNIDELAVGPYLSGLVRAITKSFNNGKAEIHTFFHEEMVHVDVLLPLGLIVNELITNIFKHAFPDDRHGQIWIRYEKITEGPDQGNLRKVTIADDGVGFAKDLDFSSLNSLGSQLIISLTHQLNGEIYIDGSNGGSFTITLPVRAGKPAKLNIQTN